MKLTLVFFLLMTAVFARAASSEASKWSLGLGLGPNFSQIDAINDDLKSSIGAAAWLSNQWGTNQRLDFSLNYFSFTGSTDYRALSVAYGWRFMQDRDFKPFAMLGLGMGMANNFPFSVNTAQTPAHFFTRVGADNVFELGDWQMGLMIDYFIVKLDGNLARNAYLGLPLLTFKYDFDDDEQPAKPVAANRAPQDSDNDGVIDSKDECPDTPKNTKVNSIGCPREAVIKKTLRVEFKTDKAVILPDYYGRIEEFAQYMKTNGDLKVIIEGHTDSVGSRKHNIKLSQARADAVRKVLINRHHVEASRIKAVGYGPDRPEVKNNSEAAMQINRRVVALVQTR